MSQCNAITSDVLNITPYTHMVPLMWYSRNLIIVAMGKLNWSRLEEYLLRQVHSNILPASIAPSAAAGTIRHLSAVCFQTNSNGSNVKPSCLSHQKPEPARVSIRYLRSCAGDWWCTGVGRGLRKSRIFHLTPQALIDVCHLFLLLTLYHLQPAIIHTADYLTCSRFCTNRQNPTHCFNAQHIHN